jgi:ribonuclease R
MVDRSSIVRFLKERAERPVRAKEIARALKVDSREYAAFKRTLREMEDAGEIYRVRRGRYAAPSRINLVVGHLQVTRGGHGFVVPDKGDGDVFVPASRLGHAYDGDRVVARIERRVRGRNPEGSILKVLERARTQVVGLYHRSGRYGYLVPVEETLHRDVFLPVAGETEVREGDLVVARITDWGSDHHDPVGEVTEVLGRPGEPGVDVLAIVHAHELAARFPDAVLAEARELARRSGDAEGLEDRKDLRELLSFTIDPVDAKDHDDALSIEASGRGTWQVGVHIADVSHYVAERSNLDLEAFSRGTSVYLVDRVLPMLPDILSGDLCSLKPGEERLTLSLLMEMDDDANVVSLDLVAGVIRSRHALSYEEAQEIIDNDVASDVALRDSLRKLRDLSAGLRQRRQAQGGLDFDLPEARVILNAAGEPTDIHQLLRLDTHRLIEEFMILANESVARLARKRRLPFIYRVHEAPDPDRLERLREFVAGLGLKLPKTAHRSSRALQKLLQSVEGRPEESVVSTLVLRSMKQARYSAQLQEHFGLGSRAYTHFTSPIRRYPDLVVHRLVRAAFLKGERIPESMIEELDAIAQQSSNRERQAMEAERDSIELKRMEFMERHLGDEFEGTISGVTNFGLFVLLDDVLVEGLIHVSQLADDYYHYVEEEYALIGEHGRRVYRLGDRITVQVLAVDREARKLDLGLAVDPVSKTN